MGTLSYGPWSAEFEDRLLAHLQIVVVNKFRRGESFLMSWIDSTAIGDGRSALWLTPATPAHFRFSGTGAGDIDPAWLRRLNASAATPNGLVVTDALGTPARAGTSGAMDHVPRASGGHEPHG